MNGVKMGTLTVISITSGHCTGSFTNVLRAMANVRTELVRSGRGTNLLLRGYALRKDRRYATKQHWRCTASGCPGRAHTDFSDPPIVLSSSEHNHIPDEEHITLKRTKHRLCEAARNRPLVSLSQVSGPIFNQCFDPKRHLPYWACARALSVRAAL